MEFENCLLLPELLSKGLYSYSSVFSNEVESFISAGEGLLVSSSFVLAFTFVLAIEKKIPLTKPRFLTLRCEVAKPLFIELRS